MSQLVPKKGDINQMMTQIEVREKTIFDDVNRNNVNRGNVVYSPTEVFLQRYFEACSLIYFKEEHFLFRFPF